MHRLDDLVLGDVDDRDVVGVAVGRVEALLVRRERELPDALADQQVFLDLEGLRRRSPRPGWPGPSATKAFLRSLVTLMPTGWIASVGTPGISKVILWMILRVLRVDDADRAADLGRDPDLGAVAGELGEARALVDQHVVDDLVASSVSMKCAMLVVSEVLTSHLAVVADAHALGLDADRDLGHHRAARRCRSPSPGCRPRWRCRASCRRARGSSARGPAPRAACRPPCSVAVSMICDAVVVRGADVEPLAVLAQR